MREGRWTTVTESDFDHEHRGLQAIRERLPDTGVWRAWSNFTFTANSGHVREVDLLVLSPSGLHMVELKNWHGSVTTEYGSWVQTRPNGSREVHGNPRHLVEKKARELAGLLKHQGVRNVYVTGSVCFTDSSVRLRLPSNDQNGLYFIDGLLEMLQRPPYDAKRRITGPQATQVATGLKQVGIHRSDAQYKVGPYLLDRKPFDTGPTWVDHIARHTDLDEQVRVRVYLVERGASAAVRKSVENAARRESAVLNRFRHPGVVRFKQYDPSGHRSGPALIFEHDPRTLSLEEYLIRYGDRLDILTRMSLVRQLAETVRSAHSRRIHHRTLSAHAVHVLPGSARHGGEDARWLAPGLRISDWQVAVRHSERDGTRRLAPTSLSLGHVSDRADAYLAPELSASRPDPVYLDVYGLGVLVYLLATGRPPAESQAELLARLEAGEGLRPSAVVDGLSQDIDELVQAATAYHPEQRLSSVDEFLEMLECVEDSLTAPASEAPVDDPGQDPLEASPGDVLAGRWEVQRQLGTGSTSRALLVRDLTVDPEVKGARPLAVLKVSLSDSRGEILVREAEILSTLRVHQGIIRLVEPEPLTIGGRTVLALEYVGDERTDEERGSSRGTPRRREETVARQLRESGRMKVDQLYAYGDYLFGAVDSLESEGIWHRDIKPDNIAIRVRTNRTRELVLIDFSLAGYPAKTVEAGTDGYLDPFIGGLKRSVYDNYAERYAIAVTLHEMASGELPRWGDGTVVPVQTDAEEWPYPQIAAEAFDPAVREGLEKFFRKALHRDAAQRFGDLKPMRDRWRKIFLDAQNRPSSGHPTTAHPTTAAAPTTGGTAPAGDGAEPVSVVPDAEPLTTEQQRDELAGAATRETHLSTAGLSPTAESALYDLGITTVGELLEHSQRKFLNAPGMGAKTRGEIQRRQREWGERLRPAADSPLTPEGRRQAAEELGSDLESALTDRLVEHDGSGVLPGEALRSVSLDALATLFVPKRNNNGSNANTVEAVRLLLRLPDEQGALPRISAWPRQKDVAEAVDLNPASISLAVKEQRKRWKALPAVQVLREEILELLRERGRAASVAEIADALIVRRGTRLRGRERRRALALAAVRAVVEVEQLVPEEAAFQHQANRKAEDADMSAGLLALEVGEDEAPDTPSAPGLLDYAMRLGRAADRLGKQDTLPTTATVLAELGAVEPPPGRVEWNERRLVEMAAAASTNAAVTPRLEIYPRDLSLVRALRLSQAGLVREIHGLPWADQPGLPPGEIHERVRARFPDLVDARGHRELPFDGPLTKALKDAGFDLVLATRENTGTRRYLPPKESAESSYRSMGGRRRSTRVGAFTRYADDPQIADAAAAEEHLAASARRDGFRVLTVRTGLSPLAVAELSEAGGRFAAEEVSVTGLFLEALHALVDPKPKPSWETILKADAAPAGSNAARRFAEYATTAWGRVEPRLRELLDSGTGAAVPPVLMTDTGVFARYDAMDALHRLAEVSRQGGRGLWMLCPQDDPAREPRLGGVAVPYQAALGEWVRLSDAWVNNLHRSGT
ncbi:Serine/threonine protein kinase [Nocardiopsis flavescens]|uniref:Serine/threonine protein kinase n=1 Tax=Nocardiopsis flavescens TaxID=758803 RepID=A0A1M6H577_9ACTN|nr:BREX system serine/threonine kinase PglW [Nocardiopsis flavescens]SHJ17363.1 Serine/threonine protein kinase [Nocardiopsis flavescens]